MVTEIVDLDLGSNSSFKIITMEGDICSRFIEFHLSYNGEVFNLQNKSVKCRYVIGKTTEEVNLVINDRVNGVCTLEIPYRITSIVQNGKCELIISQSGEILSTIPFSVEVCKSLVERAPVESSSEFGALNDALWKIDGVDNRLNSISSQLEQIETSTRQEIDVERKRIDNLTSLSQGSTTGDAELQDIRVGADGITSSSAGVSVRRQFNNTKNALAYKDDMIRNGIYNIFLTFKKPSTDSYYLTTGKIPKPDAKMDFNVKNGYHYKLKLYTYNELKVTYTDVGWTINNNSPEFNYMEIELYRDDKSNLIQESEASNFNIVSYYPYSNNKLYDLIKINESNIATSKNSLLAKIDETFKTSINGDIDLYNLFTWRNGEYYLNSDKTDIVSSNLSYRVSNSTPITYKTDIVITTENINSFYLTVFYKENGSSTYTTVRATMYSPFIKIPANSQFYVVIFRKSENTTETADIKTFVSSVRILNKLNEKILTPKPYDYRISPPYWILHLDCARKYVSIENIKKILDDMQLNGFNQIHLHFSEDSGFRLGLDNMSFITDSGKSYDLSLCLGGEENSLKWYTQTEMDTIIDYARSKGIDVVPSFDMPGHMGRILNKFPNLGHGALDISNKESVDFAKKVVDRYSKYFSSRGCQFYNIGLDETVKGSNAVNFANELFKIIENNGLIPRMYNDTVFYNNDYECLVSKKAEIIYWATSPEWASAKKLQDAGYKLINGSEYYYYVLNGEYPNGATVESLGKTQLLTTMRGTQLVNNVYGAQLGIWCDHAPTDPDAGDNGDSLVAQIKPFIIAFGNAINTYKLPTY